MTPAGHTLESVKNLMCALALAAVAGPGIASSQTHTMLPARAAQVPARAAGVPYTAAGAARPVADATIERNIRAKFAKSKINSERFTVSVKDGVATIEGKTDVIQHKGVATRLAKTGGAAAVANHIQISEQAKAKAAARLAKYRQQGQLARAVVIPAKK